MRLLLKYLPILGNNGYPLRDKFTPVRSLIYGRIEPMFREFLARVP